MQSIYLYNFGYLTSEPMTVISRKILVPMLLSLCFGHLSWTESESHCTGFIRKQFIFPVAKHSTLDTQG